MHRLKDAVLRKYFFVLEVFSFLNLHAIQKAGVILEGISRQLPGVSFKIP